MLILFSGNKLGYFIICIWSEDNLQLVYDDMIMFIFLVVLKNKLYKGMVIRLREFIFMINSFFIVNVVEIDFYWLLVRCFYV